MPSTPSPSAAARLGASGAPPRPASRSALAAGLRLLVLALVLAAAQIGALGHYIGHFADVLADISHVQDHPDDEDQADGVCAECLALVGIDLPLDDGGGRAVLAAGRLTPPDHRVPPPLRAAALPPRCRAPPALA
ncbi:hypothetical protein [Pseudothauera rhizosphaerae]|uniref:DUF2946 domain-containing protein n=1 Tax=Pseudothauera rhizosphaerae TaxID=2565932 RepID=A0A4S4B0G2_9RHOO|nr:hypothetical protein [Pseudothauera rhizosphaerae]THF65114.1 hypothetical protein E6O51_00465 [Pseudothauera rhizosphaerae]